MDEAVDGATAGMSARLLLDDCRVSHTGYMAGVGIWLFCLRPQVSLYGGTSVACGTCRPGLIQALCIHRCRAAGVCACMHVCMYVCLNVCTYACMHVRKGPCTHDNAGVRACDEAAVTVRNCTAEVNHFAVGVDGDAYMKVGSGSC